MHSSVKLPPDPSLEPTATGLALGPLAGFVHHPLRGPSTTLARAAQLKRWAAPGIFRWNSGPCIAIMQYRKATLLARSKEVRNDGSIVEVVIWSLPEPLPPSQHSFKYRLYYGQSGEDRVRYDNERGKGDHRHVNGHELAYVFESLDKLLDDFDRDVQDWRAP